MIVKIKQINKEWKKITREKHSVSTDLQKDFEKQISDKNIFSS